MSDRSEQNNVEEIKKLRKEIDRLKKENKEFKHEYTKLKNELRHVYNDFSSLVNSYRYRVGNRMFKILNMSMGKGAKENYHFLLIKNRLDKIFNPPKDPRFSKKIDLSQFLSETEDSSYKNTQNKNQTAVIVSWDMGHNPVGRAFLFAEFLSKDYNTTLVGPVFPKYGYDIWEPIVNRDINFKTFEGCNFPEFLNKANEFTKEIQADLIVICKPRIPSLLVGNLIQKNNPKASIVLDIDDYELSFFENEEPLEINKINLLNNKLNIPYNETWTRISESLVSTADYITVSNKELQNKFGGELLPHVRNELIFDKSIYPRTDIRQKFGYSEEDKVIFFIGTPRYHKGINEIVEAIKVINNPQVKLCVIGEMTDARLINKLSELPGDSFQNYTNIPFDYLPQCLSAADLICLYQDPENSIAQYQMPAKVSDAISMEVPLITSNAAPLLHLEKAGVLTCVESPEELPEKINEALFDPSFQKANRNYFLETHSYAFGVKTFEKMLQKPSSKLSDFPFDRFDAHLNHLDQKEGIDVVFFWKQNDSDLYGRRQDMLVKYLAKSDKVRRILHFDAPIFDYRLKELKQSYEGSQNAKIAHYTSQRINYERDGGNIYRRVFQAKGKLNSKEYVQFIQEEMDKLSFSTSDSIFWFCPIIPCQKEILDHFTPKLIVNDIIDDQTQYLTNQRDINQMLKVYNECLTNSSINLCNTIEVQKRFTKHNLKLITNGAEVFSQSELSEWKKPTDLPQNTKPILGYVGNLDPKRLDLDLVKELAQKFTDCEIVFIGSTHMGESIVELAKHHPNLHLLGIREYQEALQYINQFDVALIPHLVNDMTKYMNPLKMYNYASLGKTIVATDLAGMEIEYTGLKVAQNHNEFIHLVKESIGSGNNRLSDKYTWASKANDVINAIETVIMHA